MVTKKRKKSRAALRAQPIKVIASAKAGVNTESIDNRISDLADKFKTPLDVGTDFPATSNFSRDYEFITSKLSKEKIKELIKILRSWPEIDNRSITKIFL